MVLNNKTFLDYVKEIYPSQMTAEKANKSDHLADYLDRTFIIDSGGKLQPGYMINMMTLTSMLSIFHSFPATHHLQLIRYARCCSHYDDLRYRHKCLVDRLLSQGYIALGLESFKKFYGRYQNLTERYQRSVKAVDNLYLTCSRNLVAFVIYMDLSILKLIVNCGRYHA